MAQPGTMIYFDLLDDLEDYTDEEAGQILKSMLRYGVTGEVPNFSDRGMRTLWRKIQSSIDRDGGRYENAVNQRKYAAYCRKIKKNGGIPIPYDEWITTDNGPITTDNGPITTDNGPITTDNGPITDDNFRYPSSTATSSSTSTSTSSSAATTNNPSVSAVFRAYDEKIGGVINEQIKDELIGYINQMGAECCIMAMDEAIISNARNWRYVKNTLKNKLKSGVRSADDWKRVEEEFQQRKAQQTGGGRGYQQKQDDPWSYPEYTKEELEAMGSL